MVCEGSGLLMTRNIFATWLNMCILFPKTGDLTKVLVSETFAHDLLHIVINICSVI